MKKIIVLKGLPASGKSTYAKQLVKDNPGMYKRINRDDLRHMMDAYHLTKSNEKFVKRTRDWLICEALKAGKHVIVDDTNLSESNVIRIEQLAREVASETQTQIKVEVKAFEVELEEAIRRDALRENPVGANVIKRMHRQFYPGKKVVPEYRLQDKQLPNAIICDLDGTLALIHDRNPFDASKCEQDLPNQPVIDMVKQYKALGYAILLLSGRDGRYKQQTVNWLEQHGIAYDGLWLRPEKDGRKDAVIKKELFENHIENRFNVAFVLDDRDQVVELWRKELKLPCFQVFYGDF